MPVIMVFLIYGEKYFERNLFRYKSTLGVIQEKIRRQDPPDSHQGGRKVSGLRRHEKRIQTSGL